MDIKESFQQVMVVKMNEVVKAMTDSGFSDGSILQTLNNAHEEVES